MSKRKKAEKAKDFAKKKLKVGKTAAKADNHTDTSFKSKTISLPKQGLTRKNDTDSQEPDLAHHLSLTKHHANTTRKEVLNFIELHLPSNPTMYKNILMATIPMVHDQSQMVRTALVSLLEKCAEKQPGLLELHLRSTVLFIHSAMTHIQPDIRNNSSKFLQVLLNHASAALVKSYFVKTMKSYFNVLSWTLSDDKKSLSLAVTTSSSVGGSTKKARISHLAVLKQFLTKALFEEKRDDDNDEGIISVHPMTERYLIPTDIPQPYEPLNLFVTVGHARLDPSTKGLKEIDDGTFSVKDLDTISAEDLLTRRKVTMDVFYQPMVKNLQSLITEGGEVGKEANGIIALLEKLQEEMKEKET